MTKANPNCNCVLLIAFSVYFCALFVPVSLLAAPVDAYPQLRSRYLKLRNTDATISRLDDWSDLAQELLNFAGRAGKTHRDTPFAVVDASILYEKMYRRFGDRAVLSKVVNLLERVAKDFPGHQLADDGLIRRGDLLLYELNDVDQARRNYEEITEAYPASDMYPVAVQRLKIIATGEYLKQGEAGASEDDASHGGSLLIVIDPGHGGEDFGAVGQTGLLEKDVTLAVSFELERMLTEKLGATVRLTRRTDEFVPLMDRTMIANDFEADVFVSLHVNASEKKNLSGFEVYYLDNTGNQASQRLAERENASTRFEGAQGDLQYMLSDLIQNAKMEDSIALAKAVNSSVSRVVLARHGDLKSLGIRQAPFYVLVGAHMPCVLVEMFFIDHKNDGRYLVDPDFRKLLAQGIFDGIRSYLDQISVNSKS